MGSKHLSMDPDPLRLIIPPDVVLTPALRLEARFLVGIKYQETDYVLARRGSRRPAKIVDRNVGELLQEFRVPSAINEAVARFSDVHSAPRKAVLKAAYRVLKQLYLERFLVPHD